jgi:hypothetical protein
MHTFARNIGQLLQLREEKQAIANENKLFTKALTLNSSYYLILNQDRSIKEIGNNFLKSIPSIGKGKHFDDFFKWFGKVDMDGFMISDKEDYGRLLFMDCNLHPQR